MYLTLQGGLWSNHHGRVIRLWNFPLEHLDLHVGKSFAHARVPAAAESDEREGLLLVLLPPWPEAIGIVRLGIGVNRLEPVRESRRRANDVP